jgi:ribosomal protein S18 acetylase RimI-like enzyme
MEKMQIRPATPPDYPDVEKLVMESFEPVTWARRVDERFGPLNGLDWHARWRLRLRKAFAEQIILVGAVDGVLTAVSTTALDRHAALAYIDILAVARGAQRHGYGRQMLRATIGHMKELGARYVNLECLTGNDNANALYESEGFEEVARHIRWFRKI